MKNIQVEFGGFYYSIHEQFIDSMIDSYYQDDLGDTLDYYLLDINYQDIFSEYSKFYLQFLNESLRENAGIDCNFTFQQVDSPREYNFKTDVILAKISDANYQRLLKYFRTNSEFIGYLREAVKSRDGYISFYDFNDAYNDVDEILLVYAFRFYCDKYNDEFIYYYDRNYGYEMIYSMDLPLIENDIGATA
jgi:hypothetical protein